MQRIRGESEELRSLQEKLRTAEVNMQRKLQLDEKAMLQERDRQYAAGMDAEVSISERLWIFSGIQTRNFFPIFDSPGEVISLQSAGSG